jgi:aryl-alcohol dehydrogenase-like predicted oxidoreductase
VGVSNFAAAQMAEFARIRPVETLQPPYHLFRRGIEAEVLPYTQEHDIGVLVYGPLAHGLLTGTLTEHSHFAPDDWRSDSPLFQGETYRRNLEVELTSGDLAESESIMAGAVLAAGPSPEAG